MRFWDALFGAASFVYVFLIGTWLLNPVCGFIAVLLLFAHAPLVFSHGLRSNTMDSALVLAYCGGIYHYLRWIAPFDVRTTRRRTFERSNDERQDSRLGCRSVLRPGIHDEVRRRSLSADDSRAHRVGGPAASEGVGARLADVGGCRRHCDRADRAVVRVRDGPLRRRLLADDPGHARLPAVHVVARSRASAPLALLSRPDVRFLGIRCTGADHGRVRACGRMDGTALCAIVPRAGHLAGAAARSNLGGHFQALPLCVSVPAGPCLDGRVLCRSRAGHRMGVRSTVRWIGRTHARQRERLD